jgi:hypothetical protein
MCCDFRSNTVLPKKKTIYTLNIMNFKCSVKQYDNEPIQYLKITECVHFENLLSYCVCMHTYTVLEKFLRNIILKRKY